jgi:uncharacterized protein DUF1566
VGGGWRLPNTKELQSLIDFGTGDPALPSGHRFPVVNSYFYWSSASPWYAPDTAWFVTLNTGVTDRGVKPKTWRIALDPAKHRGGVAPHAAFPRELFHVALA